MLKYREKFGMIQLNLDEIIALCVCALASSGNDQ